MIRAKLIEEYKAIYIGTICKECSLADHKVILMTYYMQSHRVLCNFEH
jgi:hypothetical protein